MMSIKKYVKALVKTTTKSHLEEIYNQLVYIEFLKKNQKYKLIINSPIISKADKVEFLVSTLNITDSKIINLLKLLVENNRLNELPRLIFLLKDIIAELTGDYKGYIITKDQISESKLAEIETKLSSKFNKNIKLEQKLSKRGGIQVYVESLNIEVAIFEEDIKEKLIKDIIRAI